MQVWSLDQTICYQTLHLDFPSFNILGKEIEFGRPALYTETDVIVVTCCEQMTTLTIKDEIDNDSSSEQSSEAQIEDKSQREEKIQPFHYDDYQTGGQLKSEASYDGPDLSQRDEGRRRSSNLFPSPRHSDSNFSSASGWSSVRHIIQNRLRGKLFQQKELEDDSQYVSFRYFTESHLENQSTSSLNILKVKKYSNSTKMEKLARDNMPFMGLEIHGLEDIVLPKDLPHTITMKQKGIKIETIDDLLSAKLDVPGSLTSGGGPDTSSKATVGEPSSMTTESRRSSVGALKIKKDLILPPAGAARKVVTGDPKGLPIITEKSDTQSVITEEASDKDV